MKKVAFLALALSMVLSMQAGAATIGVPWFVDNAPVGSTLPPAGGKTTTIVYLNNSGTDPLPCAIQYYDANGNALAFAEGQGNTFEIAPKATIAFRPVADDENTSANPNGQEVAAGAAVPNRPRHVNAAFNGSLVISYDESDGAKVTGKGESWGSATLGGATVALNSAYLLPN